MSTIVRNCADKVYGKIAGKRFVNLMQDAHLVMRKETWPLEVVRIHELSQGALFSSFATGAALGCLVSAPPNPPK